MLDIRRVRVRSVIKISIALHVAFYILAGLLITAFYALIHGFLVRSFLASGISALNLLLIWLAGTVFVAIYAFFVGWIAALLYNVIASWWGGLVIDVGVVGHQQSAFSSQQQNVPDAAKKGDIPQTEQQTAAPSEPKKEQRRKPKEKSQRTLERATDVPAAAEKKEPNVPRTAETDKPSVPQPGARTEEAKKEETSHVESIEER